MVEIKISKETNGAILMTKVLERLAACPHSTIVFRNIDRFVGCLGDMCRKDNELTFFFLISPEGQMNCFKNSLLPS